MFSLRLVTGRGCLLIPILLNIVQEILGTEVRQEEIRGIQIKKDEVKLSL